MPPCMLVICSGRCMCNFGRKMSPVRRRAKHTFLETFVPGRSSRTIQVAFDTSRLIMYQMVAERTVSSEADPSDSLQVQRQTVLYIVPRPRPRAKLSFRARQRNYSPGSPWTGTIDGRRMKRGVGCALLTINGGVGMMPSA